MRPPMDIADRRIAQLEGAARAMPTFHFSGGFHGFTVYYYPGEEYEYSYHYRGHEISREDALRILASQPHQEPSS